jgi:heptosyltransferase-2
VSERLLVFAPNWLGDAVMALPAIARAARATKAGVVDVAARSPVAPLFSMTESVGKTIVLTGKSDDIETIRAGGYDAALLLPNSFAVARLAWKAGVPERWGYRADFRRLLLTRGIFPPSRLHQTEYYRFLVDAVLPGAPKPTTTEDRGARESARLGPADVPTLQLAPGQRANGATRLVREGWDGVAPLIAMAPGAAFGGAKRWPAASFAALAASLSTDGVSTVLVGSAGDVRGAAEMTSSLQEGPRPLNLVGKTDLVGLAGVLVNCRALVTNDSGAMHFAAALGLDVTAMFGPTRERETRPIGPGRHAVLTNPTWCRPCMLRECPLTHRCMTGITVDAVLNATRPFLS